MLLRKVFWIATICIASVLMSLAPAQASPVLIGGLVYGAYPATVAPNRPTALIVSFNGQFQNLSRVCIGLQFNPQEGGEALTPGEKGLMQLPGGGPGTPFGSNAPDAGYNYKTVCTSDPADLAVLKYGAWQIRLFMTTGSMTITSASANAER